MAKFSETQPPKQEMETDRTEFRAGDVMQITGIVLSESEKYGLIGRVNGIGPDQKILKKRTTSKVLVDQLGNIMTYDKSQDKSQLADPVSVRVDQVKGAAGRMYLTFADP